MAWQISKEELVKQLSPEVIYGAAGYFEAYSTDTRNDLNQKLFIALKGDTYDAHDFLDAAIDAGACGLLVHKPLSDTTKNKIDNLPRSISVFQVSDTLKALQELALQWRRKNNFGVIGITGSNGKTTTKEFVNQILKTKYRVYASEGSLNNHWGVPFTLLNAEPQTQWVVCEMGMNSPGEIARLCEVAEPNVTCVTFVGRGHLEGMGSIENIAKEKSDIYRSSPNAKKVYNMQNPHTSKMKQEFYREGDLQFGGEAFDISMKCEESDFESMSVSGHILKEKFECIVPVYGEHNVTNLMAAAGLASACGMSSKQIIDALPKVKMAWGRNQVEKIGEHLVVFDGYNANPESMEVFLNNAKNQHIEANKVFVLGEMMELGSEAEALHRELGQKMAELEFDRVGFFGPSFKHFEAGYRSSRDSESLVVSGSYEESLALKLKNMLQPNDAVFIKGSRGVKLERFLQFLKG